MPALGALSQCAAAVPGTVCRRNPRGSQSGQPSHTSTGAQCAAGTPGAVDQASPALQVLTHPEAPGPQSYLGGGLPLGRCCRALEVCRKDAARPFERGGFKALKTRAESLGVSELGSWVLSRLGCFQTLKSS
eukprot:1159850-Pelagomonas_calceolata.AAC.2